MRSESEIKNKYSQLLGRNLEKLFQKKLGKKPHNCAHNEVHSSLVNKDNRIQVEHTGLCMLNKDDPSSWEGKICETTADARFCPYFSPKHTKQEVYDEFMLKTSNNEVLQQEFRDLYILKWALGEEVETPKVSIIDRLKLWVRQYIRDNYFTKFRRTDENNEIDIISKSLFQEDVD